MNKADLIAFEAEVKRRFEAGQIHAPVHLSNGNEDALIDIFRDIKRGDWVFSTWRNHYHALLHGVPPAYVMHEVMAGRSINLRSAEHRFHSSAIVGGCLPIAVGVAAAGMRAWCFVGDMAASCGMFHDCTKYAAAFNLPVNFIVEDNGYSTTTPTLEVWGGAYPEAYGPNIFRYKYRSEYPHVGAGKQVTM